MIKKYTGAELAAPRLEVKPMEEAIEKAVKLLAEKITKEVKSEDALRFTQAALNLEHVLAVKVETDLQRRNL